MIKTGYSKKNIDALLKTHHRVDIILQLMDLSHRHLSEHSDILLGGQVNIDVTAEVTRNASVDLRDPLHKLQLDDKAPEDGSLFYTRMIRLTFVISPPDNSVHYPIPIFTGPISRVTRNGPVVTVEAQGKEVLSFGTIWTARTLKKGLKKTEAIQRIMGWTGETKMQFLDRGAHLGVDVNANRKSTFWKLARKIAGGMNLQLFYDGRGVLRLRRQPTKSVYEFTDDGVMVSLPQTGYAMKDEFFNAVEIVGGKPKGKKEKKKKDIRYRMVAPRNHPFSPWNMGRNGTPRFIPKVIEDDSIKSKKAAKAVAKRELNNGLTQTAEVSFDSLPIPYLEENDLYRYRTKTTSGRARLKQMSIPLTVDGTSSIGFIKKTSPRVKGGRHRHHRHRRQAS